MDHSHRILLVLATCLAPCSYSAAALIATNVAGDDGTQSRLNIGAPPSPIVITGIEGLAITDTSQPGNNLMIGGGNFTPDVRVMDTHFQANATVGPSLGSGSPPASFVSRILLVEALNSGTVEQQEVQWSVAAFSIYDGTGQVTPATITASQTSPSFEVFGVTLSVSGDVVAGDKFVVHNSGRTNWALLGSVDVDGNGIPSFTANVCAEDFLAPSGADSNTSQDFNDATVTMLVWEIADGEFVSGSFDVTFTQLTTVMTTWPGGDRFDVTPEPATLSLIALGGLAMLRRRRR